jgi:hypothetical protein
LFLGFDSERFPATFSWLAQLYSEWALYGLSLAKVFAVCPLALHSKTLCRHSSRVVISTKDDSYDLYRYYAGS